MPKFEYVAKKKPKELIKGVIETENENAVIDYLYKLNYFPVSIALQEPRKGVFLKRFSCSIGSYSMSLFSRQLSDLLDSGMPILKACEFLSQQTPNGSLREHVKNIYNEIKSGSSFSDALAKTKIFNAFFINMVKAGEISGKLEEVLNNLADISEKDEEIKHKILSSIAYPALIVMVGIATIIFLMTSVIPKISILFAETNQILPLPTRILIFTSNFFVSYWWTIILFFAASIIAIREFFKTSKGQLLIDKFKLQVPVVGDLFQKVELFRFTRSLGVLLENGVPILDAIVVTKQVVGNLLIKVQLENIYKRVSQGETLSKCLGNISFFPATVVSLVATGEETGTLGAILLKIANSYEQQSDRVMKTITSLIEPIVILIMGIFVGFIVISILMPIFQINILMR